MKGIMLPTKEEILNTMKYETLCQDDFIEWILRNTAEDNEFRVYMTKNCIQVGIDNPPVTEEP